jgi:hypothetical protein
MKDLTTPGLPCQADYMRTRVQGSGDIRHEYRTFYHFAYSLTNACNADCYVDDDKSEVMNMVAYSTLDRSPEGCE